LMGFVRVKFRIYNPADRSRFADVEGVVDTGAIYTVVGRKILESIGIAPVEKRSSRLLAGRLSGRWGSPR